MLRNGIASIGREAMIAGVVCLIVGCLIGWVVLGWVIWPVSWTNADPYDLRPEEKAVYVSMVAYSYSLNEDGEWVRQRMAGFDEQEVSEILTTLIEEREAARDAEGKRRLQYLALALEISAATAIPSPEATPQPSTGGIASLVRTMLPICGVLVLLLLIVALIAIVVFRLLQRRSSRVPAEMPGEGLLAAEAPERAALGQFVTTYNFGDDGYDTSFNIETPGPGGEFYGACGVGFSEVVGEGSPDKIVAFEIWLFDKTDLDNVQTVTKVLMSEFAYHNDLLRAKMRDRGEAILAEEGQTIVIDAVGLQLSARIVDFVCGTDPSLPPDSYFETLTTELVPMFKS